MTTPLNQLRGKKWIFVLHKWTPLEYLTIASLTASYATDVTPIQDILASLNGATFAPTSRHVGKISYLLMGREWGKEGTTPHLQGYLETNNRITGTALKKMFPNRVHLKLSAPKATIEHQLKYIGKEDKKFLILGTPMAQGARTDLEAIRHMIENNIREEEIAETYFSQWVRYRQSFTAYRQLIATSVELEIKYPLESFPREWQNIPKEGSIILWGHSGIGKTQFALALLGPKVLFVSHIDDLAKFDSLYHTGIIFDDMNFDHIPRSAQIHIVDQDQPRSIHCRYKCASIPAHTPKIFTTNVENGNIFLIGDPAIKRRISIHHLACFK